MLFDLLQVATDLGRQMESLMASDVQHQQHEHQHEHQREQNQQRSHARRRPALNRVARRAQEAPPAIGDHQAPRSGPIELVPRSTAYAPLDLSVKTPGGEAAAALSCREVNNNSEQEHATGGEEAPLNLVKSETEPRSSCTSSASPSSSCSIFSASSISLGSLSSATCDNDRKPGCDNNNNNNHHDDDLKSTAQRDHQRQHQRQQQQQQQQQQHRRQQRAKATRLELDLRTASANEIQISSTNGRGRRRAKKLAKGAEGSKSHLCQHCGRSFSRSDMLTRHSRLHSGLKPYQCAKCLQVFSRSDHLSTHERTHTGEKPYQCHCCSYSACRRDMITRHMRTHTMGRLGGKQNGRLRQTGAKANRAGRLVDGCAGCDDGVSTSAEIGNLDEHIH